MPARLASGFCADPNAADPSGASGIWQNSPGSRLSPVTYTSKWNCTPCLRNAAQMGELGPIPTQKCF